MKSGDNTKNKLTNAKRGTVRSKSVEEIEQQPKAAQGKAINEAVATSMAEWMAIFCGDFHTMLAHYIKYVQKYGSLSDKVRNNFLLLPDFANFLPCWLGQVC